MRRSIRIVGVTLLVLAFASAAMAQNANQRVVGKKGIGYYTSDAPFGLRYWMNDAMAIDVGVGLGVDTKADFGSTPTDETLLDYAFEVGLPWALHSEENMIVYFRPGVGLIGNQQFTNTDVANLEKGYLTTVRAGIGLGGEFFLGQLGWPNLSFSGQIGINLDFTSFPDFTPATGPVVTRDSDINISTSTDRVSVVDTGSLGFHIYF